jgi:hypothetical protein
MMVVQVPYCSVSLVQEILPEEEEFIPLGPESPSSRLGMPRRVTSRRFSVDGKEAVRN